MVAAAKTTERESKEAARKGTITVKLKAEEEKWAKATAKEEQRRAGKRAGE